MKAFDEWHGGCQDKGYDNYQEAERIMFAVQDEMSMRCGIKEIKVNVEDKNFDGKFWVHNTSVYDPDARY